MQNRPKNVHTSPLIRFIILLKSNKCKDFRKVSLFFCEKFTKFDTLTCRDSFFSHVSDYRSLRKGFDDALHFYNQAKIKPK